MSKLTESDLELLRDTAARFFDDQLPVDALRRLRDEADDIGFNRVIWREMAEMGWAGILIDERHGGIDPGHIAMGSILEQAGRTLAASPLISTAVISAPIIAHSADSTEHEGVLARMAAGDCILALAHEEGSRHAPHCIATRAEKHGKTYLINGRKTFVLDGHAADHLIVVTRTDGGDNDRDGLTLFLVDATASGIRRMRTNMVDARNSAKIEFEKVAVTENAVIGTPGSGLEILEPVLDGARAGLAAEMLGTGQEVFDRTLEYLKVREQFGAPIGSFQALKHRAAEMYCEIELTRSATYGALAAIDAKDGETAALASAAKAKACDMLELVSNEAIQMHGGIGMTDEADIGLFLKRARVTQQILGDAIFHRDRYATLIGI